MKKLIGAWVTLLWVGLSAAHAADDVRERFAGAWRLIRLEEPGADGKLHNVVCTGLFIFTRDGHASVQVMQRNPPPSVPSAPATYSQGGYEASWGTYIVDERTRTFVFHVDGALVRSLIGKDLPRSYRFSGNQLTVKSTRTDERWSVTWERY